MTRGFVTLATGNIQYYNMALNMLKSFRIHNPDVPFAIVCDRHNEVTAQFDDVVILEKANGDYRDKFSLLVNSPYDESFFIETDCLIYKNLDFLWDLIAKESDFSAFGWNSGGVTCWFKTEETVSRLVDLLPEIEGKIDDTPLFNPGYFYIRKGEKCRKMYEDCLAIAQKISEDELLREDPSIFCRGKLRDDPIFNLAMAINGFICHAKPKAAKCMFLPSKYKLDTVDIIKGRLDVTDKNGKKFTDCALLHFSTRKAVEEGLYLWQCVLIDLFYKKSALVKIMNNRFFYGIFAIYRYVRTRLKRIF